MYLVIEAWPSAHSAHIVTDQYGINKVFDNEEDAEIEAAQCQNGKVIPI